MSSTITTYIVKIGTSLTFHQEDDEQTKQGPITIADNALPSKIIE